MAVAQCILGITLGGLSADSCDPRVTHADGSSNSVTHIPQALVCAPIQLANVVEGLLCWLTILESAFNLLDLIDTTSCEGCGGPGCGSSGSDSFCVGAGAWIIDV